MRVPAILISRAALLLFLVLAAGCEKPRPPVRIDTEYTCVFLDNGQVFVGKLQPSDSAYVLLADVFHIKSWVVQDQDKNKEIKNTISVRSSEPNGPALTYLNPQHIMVIEPVSGTSRLSELIKQAKAERSGTGQ